VSTGVARPAARFPASTIAAVCTAISTVCSAAPAIAKRVQRFIAGAFASVRENATSPATIVAYPSVTSACAMNQS
jgi:hypothetical protein